MFLGQIESDFVKNRMFFPRSDLAMPKNACFFLEATSQHAKNMRFLLDSGLKPGGYGRFTNPTASYQRGASPHWVRERVL